MMSSSLRLVCFSLINPRTIMRRGGQFLLLLLLCVTPTMSLSAGPAETSANSAPNGMTESLDSPRHMMRQFLPILRREDVDASLRYIHFPRGMNSEKRQKTAAMLLKLLNTRGQIDLARISDEADGRLYDGLPPQIEVVGQVQVSNQSIPIELERIALAGDNRSDSGADNRKVWQFSSEFVQSVPELIERLSHNELLNSLPSWLVEPTFLNIKAWQWLGLSLALILAIGLSGLVAFLLLHLGRMIVSRFSITMTTDSQREALPSMRWIAGVLTFRMLRATLELNLETRQYLTTSEKVVLIIAFVILAMHLLHIVITYYQGAFDSQGRRAAAGMLQPIEKGVKALVIVVSILAILSTFGFNVTAVLAGLGVGGLAIALAGQKTIENLFGGVSIILDQPVRVGDFVRSGEISGTVEEIGLRSTRLRTMDQTLVTIPNAEFSMMKLENFERRSKIRWAPKLGLRYETKPEQMRLLLLRIKELLIGHPMVLNDPARVRFVGFGPSSLDVEILSFIKAQDLHQYWAVVEDLNLKLMTIVEECGTGFAFPSTTVYVEQSGGLDTSLQNSAIKQARELLATKAMPQPFYPQTWEEPRTDILPFGPHGLAEYPNPTETTPAD